MRPLFLIVAVSCVAFLAGLRAEEPFFKKGDVVALVGGEDMVVASEYGYLELLLTRALPDYHLKFRNLAWEGDTVFEQPRQLNFPTWEQQLEKIGATVVICQFGQMESLAGKEKLPEFTSAYEKLIERFRGGGRRVILVSPSPIHTRLLDPRIDGVKLRDDGDIYSSAVSLIAIKKGLPTVDPYPEFRRPPGPKIDNPEVLARVRADISRDGFHGGETQQRLAAIRSAEAILSKDFTTKNQIKVSDRPTSQDREALGRIPRTNEAMRDLQGDRLKPVLDLIAAKNRHWFDYWRPQNWAFLNGDRTTQPSSRDHRDPNVRWFPTEMEQFLPLIAAKEEEIWKLAAELK